MNWSYIFQRLLLTVLVVFGVTVAVFMIIQLVPGDPARVVLGVQANEQNTAAMRERLGLNRPLIEQYVSWLAGDDWFADPVRNADGQIISTKGTNKGILRGDFGDSLITRQPIGPQISDRLPATLQLATAALLVGLSIAFPLGILSGIYRGSLLDTVASLTSQVGMSIPDFWLGILLVLFFSLEHDLLPPSGYDAPSEGIKNWLEHLVLPAITAGVISGAIMTRFIRSAMIEVMQANYIRTASAKGLPWWRVVTRHALRNALINIVTIIGLQITALFSAVVVVEIVFAWPGLGRLALDAVLDRDYPLVQGTVLIFALMVAVVNLAVDLMYFVLDPRIEYS